MSAFASALLALALQAVPPAAAQPAPAAPPDSGNTVAEVVVTAPGTDQIRAFVEDLSAPAPGTDQLARWNRTICPGVTGARPKYAEFLNDRLALAAYRVGLDVGEPGCRPNIMIVVTGDGNKTARDIVQQNPRWVDKYNEEGNRGRRALRDFVETPRPVRWWHVTGVTSSDGFAVGRGETMRVPDGGRLRQNVRQDFSRLVIVVDMNRTGAVKFGALADYVAMVALAQLQPTAKTARLDTIMNLFADDTPPSAMTEWDAAYLKGLYTVRPDSKNARAQGREIARSMRDGERSRTR
jgi:hypothetical protein